MFNHQQNPLGLTTADCQLISWLSTLPGNTSIEQVHSLCNRITRDQLLQYITEYRTNSRSLSSSDGSSLSSIISRPSFASSETSIGLTDAPARGYQLPPTSNPPDAQAFAAAAGAEIPYKCVACNKSCGSSGTLAKHQKEKCERTTHWVCQLCPPHKPFKAGLLERLERHHLDVHGGSCSHGCPKGGKHSDLSTQCKQELVGCRDQLPEKKAWGCPCCAMCFVSQKDWAAHADMHLKQDSGLENWSIRTMIKSLLFQQPALQQAVSKYDWRQCTWLEKDCVYLRQILERQELPTPAKTHQEYCNLPATEGLVLFAYRLLTQSSSQASSTSPQDPNWVIRASMASYAPSMNSSNGSTFSLPTRPHYTSEPQTPLDWYKPQDQLNHDFNKQFALPFGANNYPPSNSYDTASINMSHHSGSMIDMTSSEPMPANDVMLDMDSGSMHSLQHTQTPTSMVQSPMIQSPTVSGLSRAPSRSPTLQSRAPKRLKQMKSLFRSQASRSRDQEMADDVLVNSYPTFYVKPEDAYKAIASSPGLHRVASNSQQQQQQQQPSPTSQPRPVMPSMARVVAEGSSHGVSMWPNNSARSFHPGQDVISPPLSNYSMDDDGGGTATGNMSGVQNGHGNGNAYHHHDVDEWGTL